MRLIYILALLLAGCASLAPNQSRIRFESNPPGATISFEGGSSGTEPQIRTWTLNGPTGTSGMITATWVSGATASTKMSLLAGREGTYTFQRPTGVPGVDQDIKWAMHLDRQAAAKDAAFAATLQKALETPKAPALSRSKFTLTCKPLNCESLVTSRKAGSPRIFCCNLLDHSFKESAFTLCKAY